MEPTTIWVSRDVADRIRRLREEWWARSCDNVLRALPSAQRPADFIEVVESVAMLRDLAESDPGAVVAFIERKLSPLIAQVYNHAKLLADDGERGLERFLDASADPGGTW
ncbi:MAG: hypothetical protein QXF46_08640 [Thermofilaceae archaeon]